jgi:hypothetical protein
MVMNMLELPCKFCSRLTDEEICRDCRRHDELYKHYPRDVRRQPAAGSKPWDLWNGWNDWNAWNYWNFFPRDHTCGSKISSPSNRSIK